MFFFIFFSHWSLFYMCSIKYIHIFVQRSPQVFHLAKQKLCTHFSLTLALGNHCSAFCFYEVDYLDTTHQWNHTAFDLLWLTCFAYYNVFKVHPCCNIYQNFISLIFHCMYICMHVAHVVYLFIHLWTFRLLSLLGYCKKCYQHGCAKFSSSWSTTFSSSSTGKC